MFETTTNMIQQHLPTVEHSNWPVVLIALVIAWVVFLLIREFWCWFWRTTHLLIALSKIYRHIGYASEIGAECLEELKKANDKLERLAECIPGAAGDKQAGSAGS
jgi:hypothetical protein